MWLEDNSAATRAWIKQQNICSAAHLDGIDSLRLAMQSKMESASSYEVVEPPFHIADKYFCFKKLRSDQAQFSLYVTHDLGKDGKLVFDSRKVPAPVPAPVPVPGGKPCHCRPPLVLVHGTWISGDGNFLAYGYSRSPLESESSGAADMLSIGVRDLSRKADLSTDTIR